MTDAKAQMILDTINGIAMRYKGDVVDLLFIWMVLDFMAPILMVLVVCVTVNMLGNKWYRIEMEKSYKN